MTFEQFQATKRSVQSIEAELGQEPDSPGLIYCDCLFIEDTLGWPGDNTYKGRGRWYTIIGSMEYQSDDLAVIERHLFDFAVSEEITTP